jgi:hypothetical protein
LCTTKHICTACQCQLIVQDRQIKHSSILISYCSYCNNKSSCQITALQTSQPWKLLECIANILSAASTYSSSTNQHNNAIFTHVCCECHDLKGLSFFIPLLRTRYDMFNKLRSYEASLVTLYCMANFASPLSWMMKVPTQLVQNVRFVLELLPVLYY